MAGNPYFPDAIGLLVSFKVNVPALFPSIFTLLIKSLAQSFDDQFCKPNQPYASQARVNSPPLQLNTSPASVLPLTVV
jgi:hypothetical protein